MSDRFGDRPFWRTPQGGGISSGAALAYGRSQRILLLVLFTLLIVLRLPRAWVHGRFYAEEATVFLAYAWHRAWTEVLFNPFGGYLNLAANATTLLVARLAQGGVVPLEYAPYCTMAMALAVQLLPAVLILTGRASWLGGRVAVIAALLTIAIMPMTEEVFYNVLHIQFHLALCAALILALDVPSGRGVRIGYGVLLFVAPLCGLTPILILPLFALRAIVDRDRGRMAQFAVAAVGAAIQLLVFYGANPIRGHMIGLGMLIAMMLVRLIALPVLNVGKAFRIGKAIYHSHAGGGAGWWWAIAATVVLLGVLVVLAARRRDSAFWLLLSSLVIAAASFGFGMIVRDPFDRFSPGAGERYDFVPMVLIVLALVTMSTRDGARGRRVYAAICALVLFNGATRYLRPEVTIADGPSWPAEVAAWRRDHNHPLAVWPRPWVADLSDGSRGCSPVGPDPAVSGDPAYCESAWVASFYRTPIARH